MANEAKAERILLRIKEMDDGTILFLQMTATTRPEEVSIVNVRRYEVIRTP